MLSVQPKGKQKGCAGCNRKIKDRYLLKALDKYWHEDCLKCACCDCRLGEVGSTLYTKANLILCRRDYLRWAPPPAPPLRAAPCPGRCGSAHSSPGPAPRAQCPPHPRRASVPMGTGEASQGRSLPLPRIQEGAPSEGPPGAGGWEALTSRTPLA